MNIVLYCISTVSNWIQLIEFLAWAALSLKATCIHKTNKPVYK